MRPGLAVPVDRRTALAAVASGLVGAAAGCTSEPSFSGADVLAGPDRRLAFEPADLTVSVGETVTWGFPSGGHNVCCRPADSEAVELPTGAEPFSSYAPGEAPRRSLVPRGETYGRTFEVPGRYVYVCVPHVPQGMVGTITVE